MKIYDSIYISNDLENTVAKITMNSIEIYIKYFYHPRGIPQ